MRECFSFTSHNSTWMISKIRYDVCVRKFYSTLFLPFRYFDHLLVSFLKKNVFPDISFFILWIKIFERSIRKKTTTTNVYSTLDIRTFLLRLNRFIYLKFDKRFVFAFVHKSPRKYFFFLSMIGSGTIGGGGGGQASSASPYSASTTTTTNNNKVNNGNATTTATTINSNDPDWKSKLNLPEVDRRAKTSDVTNTSGHDFEDYCLKRELLMGKNELLHHRID